MTTQNWNDSNGALQWGTKTNETNPTRLEQLDILISLLETHWHGNGWLLDLGYGSGQVEHYIFQHIPNGSVIGIDNSPAMMKLASQRLAVYMNCFIGIQHTLEDIGSVQLPVHSFSCAIAVQSLHHLTPGQMQECYRWVYERLNPGGVFFLLDRLRVANEAIFSLMQSLWTRQDHLYNSKVAPHEGQDFFTHLDIVRDRGDHPVLLGQHLDWLEQAGFSAVCLHLHGNRGLVAGIKPNP